VDVLFFNRWDIFVVNKWMYEISDTQ